MIAGGGIILLPVNLFFGGGCVYTVKAYDKNGLFKVVKTPNISRDPMIAQIEKEPVHHDTRLSQSLSRSRAAVRDYILANDWDYFVTLTLRKEVVNRYSLSDVLSLVRPFLHELGRNKGFRYCLVPERHKDGAWHFHGVMSGIDVCDLPPWAPKDARDVGYMDWPLWANKFGFTTVDRIKDKIAVGFYVSKYITKDLCRASLDAHQHTYFHSRGLSKPVVVGWSAIRCDFFERLLTSQYNYCSVGYFKSEYEIVCAVLEELAMYRDYYLVDVDGSVVGLVGGDLEDASFSALLDQFSMFDVLSVPVESWHGSIL